MTANTTLNLGSGGDTVRTIDRTASKTQIMGLDFGGDTGAGNEALVTTTTPFPTAGTGSYFVFSSVNSSSSQLAAGQSFVGTIEPIPTALNLSLNIPTDQPLLVTVNFYDTSNSNTFIGSLPPVMVAAGVGLNRAFPTNGNYCNLVVTNIGLATTTLLIINSQYGSIPSVDQAGNTLTGVFGTGDLAGFNLVEECIRGTLPLNVSVTNPDQRDINGALVVSDAPTAQRLVATTVGQIFTIDTTGYRTLSISMGTMAGNITGTNDLAAGTTPGSISAYPIVLGAPTSSLAAATSYLIPCVTRYIRLTITTAGWATYYQRAQTVPNGYLANAPQNLTQIAGAAVSSTTAQLGLNIVNIGGTANAAQGGFVAIGSSAASNGLTLGTQITATTPAQLIVKGSAGKLMFLHVGNPNTGAVFLKLFNVTSATLGTTSATLNFYIPASSSLQIPINDAGLYFSTGICIAVTNLASLTDNTAITVGCELNYAFI